MPGVGLTPPWHAGLLRSEPAARAGAAAAGPAGAFEDIGDAVGVGAFPAVLGDVEAGIEDFGGGAGGEGGDGVGAEGSPGVDMEGVFLGFGEGGARGGGGPPGGAGAEFGDGFGPELVAVAGRGDGVEGGGGDGPEAAGAAGVVEVGVVVGGADEEALAWAAVEGAGVGGAVDVDGAGEEVFDAGGGDAAEGVEFTDFDEPMALELVGGVVGGEVGKLGEEVGAGEGADEGGFPGALGAFEDEHVIGLAAWGEDAGDGGDEGPDADQGGGGGVWGAGVALQPGGEAG